MPEVFLGLGSNVGNRVGNLRAAVRRLAPEVEVVAVSALYGSAALPAPGVGLQPDFRNAVVHGQSTLDPASLLRAIKHVERALGRRPCPRWGPRPIDIDLLLYDDLRLHTRDLVVPHRSMADRSFVLRPLADLAPDRTPPGWPESVAAACARVGRSDLERVSGPEWVETLPG